MKNSILFILTGLITITSAQAEVPQIIQEEMALRVERHQCQKQWVDLVDEYKELEIPNTSQAILAIPCSNWGLNMDWSLYFISKDNNGRATFVQSLSFIRYDSNVGIYADDMLSNIRWNPTLLELVSEKKFHSSGVCGETSGYTWDVKAQKFRLKGLIKGDNCKNLDVWEKLKVEWEKL